MEEKSDAQAARPWTDAGLVALLLVLAGGIHAWLIAHTTVSARDSIGYIRFALQLESHPWSAVLQRADQHPGYPLTVMVASWPVRHYLGTTPETLALSAQVASAIAGTLLVIPMFFLGRLLFHRRAGFWAALLFQCLPVSAHVIGDAISEAVFFLLLATSLLLAAQGLGRRSVWRLALCGLFGGLAYLTRPEGTLVVLAALGVLLLAHWPWRSALAGVAALVVGWLVAGGPYMATIGGYSPKPSYEKIVHDRKGTLAPNLRPDASVPQRVTTSPLMAYFFADWITLNPYGDHKLFVWEGMVAVLKMAVRAFQYVIWIPALIGLWWFRDLPRRSAGARVVLLLSGIHALLLWVLAAKVGYVSERHVLVLVLCGSFWAMAMLSTWVDMLMRWRVGARWQPVVTVLLMFVLTGFALPSTLKPMHANRAGHRAAGEWLKAHASPNDIIVDPYAWAHFYAGGLFAEGKERPAGYLPNHWVVLEKSDNPHARLATGLEHAKEIADQGAPVYTWQPQSKDRKLRAEEVIVYRFPAPRKGE